MDESSEKSINFDKPLRPGTAWEQDKLDRKEFAKSVTSILSKVSKSSGFALSIEGAWGSGKTSTLAMIQDSLSKSELAPLVVHFNPWLVGDRDALLRQFLSTLASAVKLTDSAEQGKKAAKALKTYSKAFDVVKLIPGAEPWSSIIKSVITSTGNTVELIADHKTLDIEEQKLKVEKALRNFNKPIIVFIDDIDRLYPREVFEMIRIIKAVGDLPNVGYVLAWDHHYVTQALSSASVPEATSYLDKIIQIRMPLPALSLTSREILTNEALGTLPTEAHNKYFSDQDQRLSLLYFKSLRDLLEQPRDFARIFNTISSIEPILRGEVVLSDIIGLAALIIKAPPVFELIKKNPRLFVGPLPGEVTISGKSNSIEKGVEKRKEAYEQCAAPDAVKRLVHFLFPQTAKSEDSFALENHSEILGRLATPARLQIALQLGVNHGDVSLIEVNNYLLHPEKRSSILSKLTERNCAEFVQHLADTSERIERKKIKKLNGACLELAKLADTPPFVSRQKNRSSTFFFSSSDLILHSIEALIEPEQPHLGAEIALSILKDSKAITLAVEIATNTYLNESQIDKKLIISESEDKEKTINKLLENIRSTIKSGEFFKKCKPGFTLWQIARLSPEHCPALFQLFKENDLNLDNFITELLGSSFDSHKGRAFKLPGDIKILEAYCTLDEIKDSAHKRIADHQLDYPAKSAWQSIIEERELYAVDGSAVNR